MRYPHAERDASFQYRYRKMREFSSRPFKFDISAPGMETDSAANRMSYDTISTGYEHSTAKMCTLSQKTKDFIGENLIDIENTLKALNLDFLQTFNDLEKNDSAETLFGENYAYDAAQINPKILNTALKLSKMPANCSSMEISPKSTKSSQYSPLDKQTAQHQFNGSLHYLNESGSTDKLLDGKRSSTPDTGFASRETNTSSRRGSQKSSYSPQEAHFNSSYSTQIDEARAAYAHLKANGSFPNRQRSMSFTENYDLKSPVLSEPPFGKFNHSAMMVGSVGVVGSSRLNGSDGQQVVRRRQRNTISHKPKSIRARNLRRLSYNPIILDSSSSSGSESEFSGSRRSVENFRTIDGRRNGGGYRSHRISAASPTKSNDDAYMDFKNWHTNSESDIRLKNRKSQAHFQSNILCTPTSQDKLYGSNASIKSAPQYNNFAMDHRQMQQYLGRKMANYPPHMAVGGGAAAVTAAVVAAALDYEEQQQKLVSSPQTPSQTPINFERNAHNRSSSSRRRHQQQQQQNAQHRNSYVLPPPPPPPTVNNRTYDLNAYSLYSQFDVSKLTGKSPTTQSFLQENIQSPGVGQMKSATLAVANSSGGVGGGGGSASSNSSSSNACQLSNVPAFQWPDKIHVSAVAAQNSTNLLWPAQQQQQQPQTPKQTVVVAGTEQSLHTVNETDQSNRANNKSKTDSSSILNFFSFNPFNLFDK